ncbi:hypothetical protein JM79_2173 [Gramella sp. Hel_I_59]|uniref:hypothetical protein n=1 Tax=Gramella sp. Hel_I_59 TaxID=1249978 RepID=UPI001150ECEA|nr:hypothetical protein [Gramella sp. Hel_I_59]TQI71246.1 hypothetical protein JM79_2173 [Gramella sp. Hel_I_59]
MISERDISEKFSAIWKQNFPLMTPSFMRVFNEAQVKKINSESIPVKANVRYDIVAETSFNLTQIVYQKNKKIDTIIADQEQLDEIVRETALTIWSSGNYTDKDLKLNEAEMNEIEKISNNTLEFISIVKKSDVLFQPKLTGYSFIPDLTADLSIDDTLYEIKTVNRNFQSSDIKQLFIYLALKQVSDSQNWKYAGLYNPRKGTYCKFNIKSLIYNITGGRSSNETFEDLLDGLIRDFEIDSKF